MVQSYTPHLYSKKELCNGVLLALLCSLSLLMEQRILLGFEEFTGITDQVLVWGVRLPLCLLFFGLFLLQGIPRVLLLFQILLILSFAPVFLSLKVELAPVYVVKYLWPVINFSLIFLVARGIKHEKLLLSSLILPMLFFSGINAILIYAETNAGIFRVLSSLPLSFCLGVLLLTFNRPFLFVISSAFFLFLYIWAVQRTGVLIVIVCFFVLGRYKELFARKDVKLISMLLTIMATLTIALLEYDVHWNGSIGTGRGNIWGHWLISLFESPQSVLFGFGPMDESSFLSIAEQGDKLFGWNITRFPHSGFLAIASTGGFFRLGVFFLLLLLILNVSRDSTVSSGLFYYSLIFGMTSAGHGLFVHYFTGFAFLLSFFMQVRMRKRTKLSIAQKTGRNIQTNIKSTN